MKRLVFVVNNPAFFVSHRLSLARAAVRAGYDVHVAAPPGDGIDEIRGVSATFHTLRMRRGLRSPTTELQSIFELVRLYTRLRPDIVHHLTAKPILWGGAAARLSPVPAVVHAITGLGHLFSDEGLGAELMRRVVLHGYRAACAHPNACVIFQNPDDLAELLRHEVLSKAQAVLIPGSGVDAQLFSPSPEPDGDPVCVLPARLLYSKGLREFADAARRLKAEGLRARFALVGPPDPENPSAISMSELNVWLSAQHLEWWGEEQDMAGLFRRVHVVCLPSYREGAPRVLLEAAASGRAIVTTDVPGCREIVEHERHGILVPARDPVRLAEALRRLLESPEDRAKFGRAARDRILDGFTDVQVAERTLAVYDRLIEKKAPL